MQAIADRRDAAALPASSRTPGAAKVPRALRRSRRWASLATLPSCRWLFDAAADADAEVAKAAQTTLTTLPGKKVDAAIRHHRGQRRRESPPARHRDRRPAPHRRRQKRVLQGRGRHDKNSASRPFKP